MGRTVSISEIYWGCSSTSPYQNLILKRLKLILLMTSGIWICAMNNWWSLLNSLKSLLLIHYWWWEIDFRTLIYCSDSRFDSPIIIQKLQRLVLVKFWPCLGGWWILFANFVITHAFLSLVTNVRCDVTTSSDLRLYTISLKFIGCSLSLKFLNFDWIFLLRVCRHALEKRRLLWIIEGHARSTWYDIRQVSCRILGSLFGALPLCRLPNHRLTLGTYWLDLVVR